MKVVCASLIALQVAVILAGDVKHLGCFADKESRDIGPFKREFVSTNKVSLCIRTCQHLGYKYAGLQYTTECFCGNNYGRYGRVSYSECDKNCPGEVSQKCGGTWRNSVYSTGSGYLGCWRDSATRAMRNKFYDLGDTMTIQSCIAKCRNDGYRYAGMQYSSQCFCSNEYQLYGKASDDECGMPCKGNGAQKCGGIWRNSVYVTQ